MKINTRSQVNKQSTCSQQKNFCMCLGGAGFQRVERSLRTSARCKFPTVQVTYGSESLRSSNVSRTPSMVRSLHWGILTLPVVRITLIFSGFPKLLLTACSLPGSAAPKEDFLLARSVGRLLFSYRRWFLHVAVVCLAPAISQTTIMRCHPKIRGTCYCSTLIHPILSDSQLPCYLPSSQE